MGNSFDYRIYQSVYDAMVSSKKNIEIRLLNEKSKEKVLEAKVLVDSQEKKLLLQHF